MNQPKIFVDEDASEEAVVSALRHLGIDVLTVLDAGRVGISDADQLLFAASLNRALYSLNARHFARLHSEFLARGKEHWGIIVIPRQRYSISVKVRRLQELILNIDANALRNSLRFL